ncbi:hypothetical protein J7M02_05490 [Candidatus Aerophobetes bacterium]|nr:hypothetical protein [Candidatus Aerophobetes bacterium]
MPKYRKKSANRGNKRKTQEDLSSNC